LKNPTNIKKFEHMKYICDKIILITKFEILNIYFKIKVVDGMLGRIFLFVYEIDRHQLNFLKFRKLKFLDEIPFKIYVFLH